MLSYKINVEFYSLYVLNTNNNKIKLKAGFHNNNGTIIIPINPNISKNRFEWSGGSYWNTTVFVNVHKRFNGTRTI